MARITLSEIGKRLEGAVHFAFGNESFDLEHDGTYETEDPGTVADAHQHPYLTVETDPSAEEVTQEEVERRVAESDDPHVNPRADHLSSEADPEVVKAAHDRAVAIQEEVQANAPQQQVQDVQSPEPSAGAAEAATGTAEQPAEATSIPTATTEESHF